MFYNLCFDVIQHVIPFSPLTGQEMNREQTLLVLGAIHHLLPMIVQSLTILHCNTINAQDCIFNIYGRKIWPLLF